MTSENVTEARSIEMNRSDFPAGGLLAGDQPARGPAAGPRLLRRPRSTSPRSASPTGPSWRRGNYGCARRRHHDHRPGRRHRRTGHPSRRPAGRPRDRGDRPHRHLPAHPSAAHRPAAMGPGPYPGPLHSHRTRRGPRRTPAPPPSATVTPPPTAPQSPPPMSGDSPPCCFPGAPLCSRSAGNGPARCTPAPLDRLANVNRTRAAPMLRPRRRGEARRGGTGAMYQPSKSLARIVRRRSHRARRGDCQSARTASQKSCHASDSVAPCPTTSVPGQKTT